MTPLLLLLPLLAQGPAAPAAGHRVGVVGLGSDAAAAGELQRSLEMEAFSLPKISLKGGSDLASALAAPSPAPSALSGPDAATLKQSADLLQQVSDAYFQDRAAVALEKLGALSALQERSGNFPAAEKVRVALWRTAVYLALSDPLQAEQEAGNALVLAPDLQVDLNEFKPSVKAVVDGVKSRGLHLVSVVVSGLPAGAQLTVDDRPVPPRFQVPAGKHRLAATAPKRRPVAKTLDVAADTSIPMVLPVAVDPALEQILDLAVWSGNAPDARTRALLATRLGVDWLVVVAEHDDPKPEARAAMIGLLPGAGSGVSPVVPLTGAGAALTPWLEGVLRANVSDARAPVAARPREPRAPAELALAADAGMVWSSRTESLGAFRASFSGAGPAIAAGASKGPLAGGLDVSYVSYALSTLEVTRADGSRQSVPGGSSLAVTASGGWRHLFGAGDEEGSPSLFAGLGLGFARHDATDVTDSSGTALGLLPAWQRIAVDARARARVPVGGGLAAVAGAAVSPVALYSETPSKSSGASPKPGLGLAWEAGLGWQPTGSRLTLDARYSGATARTAFSGPAKTSTISGATRTEDLTTLSLTARWRF